jgi:aspartate aminotransferase-like enzyme
MINHRGKKYEEIQARVVKNLQYFFQTNNDIYLLTSSGMGGLEAAVVNFFSPGDRIVSFTCGEFGNRWAEVARQFGADVEQVKVPSGTGITKDLVYETLAREKNLAGVLMTLNETATGVFNPVPELAPIIKTHASKPLLLIDSISALGAVDLPMDDLSIDVLVTASQKAWMAPPGLAMIAVSDEAWNRHSTAKMPRYYFDITKYREFSEKNQTPATPAVTTLYGLDASLQMMVKEGKENVFARHLDLMNYTRNGLKKLGLKLFVDEQFASPTVTSFVPPDGMDPHDILTTLKTKYDIVLAGGMGDTKGKILRVAHMGYVSKKEIDEVLHALKNILHG